MRYLLGIDVGTSGTKTLLIQYDGELVASATSEYELSQPQNGWAEQNPEDWWNAVKNTIRDVIGKSDIIDVKEIAGIGLTGQMHGLVMLDKDGKVLRPAIIWCDQRTGIQRDELSMRVGAQRLLRITANPATTGFTAAKLMWVREHEPHVYEKCRKILLPKDYIRYRLTGEFATDVSDASGMQMLDVADRCWSPEVLSALEIDHEILPRVYESPEVTGCINRETAESTGLRRGTPVVAGAGDNAAAAVGTGVVYQGKAFTTIGSSGVVFAHTDTPVIDDLGRVHTFCCAVPGAWHVMGVTQSAGLSLKWFRDVCCQAEMDAAKAAGRSVYELMDEMAAESPIGANRLIYLPYLMGERTPHLDPYCRGVFFGLSAMHTKRDLIRAVMEGVTYSLKDCYNIIAGMGIEAENMLVCGGGGRSPFWRQMLANVLACPVNTLTNEEGPAYGAAILSGVGVNMYASVQEACNHLIIPETQLIPAQEAVSKYEKVYSVYSGLYGTLKEEFKKLQDIQG